MLDKELLTSSNCWCPIQVRLRKNFLVTQVACGKRGCIKKQSSSTGTRYLSTMGSCYLAGHTLSKLFLLVRMAWPGWSCTQMASLALTTAATQLTSACWGVEDKGDGKGASQLDSSHPKTLGAHSSSLCSFPLTSALQPVQHIYCR